MKKKAALKTIYIFSCISVFLPWFTYNAKMMGYCWGFRFIPMLFVPLLLTGIFTFSCKHRDLFAVLAEISSAINIVILIFIFGRWQQYSNIIAGFQWADGFRTATPAYWLSALQFLLLFIFVQIVSIADRHNKSCSREAAG